MNSARSKNRDLETIAWAMVLIWWGLRWWPLAALPDGAGLLGTGVILLGLNATRLVGGAQAKGFTTLLGILLAAWGVIMVLQETIQLQFEMPLFEAALISLGIYVLWKELRGHWGLGRGAGREG